MAMLNIPSSVNDPSYRYKMPRILTQKECRGRGSKTGIMNMGAVAQAIKRDPAYLIKFFGYELGAQTTHTNKKSEGERVVVNGHHETLVFQNLVDKFIEKYVLCPACKLPEIDMVVNKRDRVVATCKACGWNGELDNQHKLAEHISKHPPGSGIGFDEETGKKTREERQRQRAQKVQKKQGDEDSETASHQSDDGKEEQTGKKDKKDKKEKKDNKAATGQQKKGAEDSETASYQSDDGKEQQKGKKDKKDKKDKKEKKAKKAKKRDEDRDDDDGSEDEGDNAKGEKSQKEKSDKEGKKDPVAKGQGGERGRRQEKEDSDSGSGVEKDSDEEEEQEPIFDSKVMAGVVSDIADFVQRKKDKLTVENLYEEVRAQQVTKAFGHKLRMYVVVSALFPKGTLDATGAASRSEFIKAFITNGALSFADWVWGFEAYLSANPTATKTWGMTLKGLYDADLVEEEEILGYYKEKNRGNPGFGLSRAAVAPFIKWLETTPDEDSD